MLVCVALALLTLTISSTATAKENKALSAKHQKIIQDFPTVRHISNDALYGMKEEDVIVFDIREADEFHVSHMEASILVSPDISSDAFLSQYAEKVRGKTVVFYCSVGQRSSILAEKVQQDLTALGSGPVYNLEGGLFKWHNDSLPLVTAAAEPTDYIHPYNHFWGRMVNQKRKHRYKLSDK